MLVDAANEVVDDAYRECGEEKKFQSLPHTEKLREPLKIRRKSLRLGSIQVVLGM
jgi:hypothetical protein